MNRQLKIALKVVGALTTVGSLTVAALCLPSLLQRGVGGTLAVLSASLMQPEQSLRVLSEAWSEQPLYADTAAVQSEVYIAWPDKVDAAEQSPRCATAAAVIPPKGEGGGTVVEEQIGGGVALGNGVYMKNTGGIPRDYAAYLGKDAGIRFTDTTEPQVLIVHTHTTESYMSYYAGYYNHGDCVRPVDAERNLCAVGEVLANRLRAAGIGVIHDTTVHDYPQYTGAYSRSEVTIQTVLAQYPTIRLVLDLHRDALQRDEATKVKPTATVNGEKAAQMMLVVSAADDSEAPNPYWEQNITLGLQLQAYLSHAYPGLMRPISFTESRYNQHLLPGSLLVEVGGDVNTFAEAFYSAGLLGDALTAVLKG